MKTKHLLFPHTAGITAILLSAIVIVIAACTDTTETPTQTPITIGHIAVAGDTPASRAEAKWTTTGDAFMAGDILTVTTNMPSIPTTTWTYQTNTTWTMTTGAPIYKEDFDPSTVTFQAGKGTANLVTNQANLDAYHAADRITGSLVLDGTELITAENNELTHTHVDIVINITPTADPGWTGIDFTEYMNTTATVRFITGGGDVITPYRATLTPQGATYRAVMPVADVPAPEATIVTIAAPNTKPAEGTYPNVGPITAGTRLTINMPYDNKRLLNPTATLTAWTTGLTYNNQHSAYDMIITNAADLLAFANLVNKDLLTTLTAIQTANITLTEEWTPIGNINHSFKGIYNGGGYNITGLSINNATAASPQGLFGYTENATLTGINLIAPNVTGDPGVGALVGDANTNTHITNCTVTGGTITGGTSVGGLVGANYAGATIAACYATDVTCNANTAFGRAGGLVGDNNGSIYFCHATGVTITGNSTYNLAGNNAGATIASCYSQGSTDLLAPFVGSIFSCHDANHGGTPGNTVRGYDGSVTLRTGPNTTREITAAIWGPGDKPTLNW